MNASALLRALLVPATLGLAAVAGIAAATNAWRIEAPTRALKLNPTDGVAMMTRVDQQLAAVEDPAKLIAETVAPARRALAQEPLNPRAIRLLGLAAEIEGKRPQAMQMFALSQRVSRRDLRTHLALIEHYSGSGNIAAALDHYDLALSTSGGAGDLLFPVLAQALTEPDIRAALAPYVRADRPWLRGFLSYAIPNDKNPENLALLVRQAGGMPKAADYREFETQLLWRLTAQGLFAEARDYYLTLPGASAAALRTAAFTPVTTQPAFGPMAWYFSDQTEASAQVADDGKLWARVGPGMRGIAAQRYLFLPPGSYAFRQTYEFSQDAGSAVWEINCMRGAKAEHIWSQKIVAVRGPRSTVAQVTIPDNCLAQMVSLEALGGDSQQEAEIVFSGLSLLPLARN